MLKPLIEQLAAVLNEDRERWPTTRPVFTRDKESQLRKHAAVSTVARPALGVSGRVKANLKAHSANKNRPWEVDHPNGLVKASNQERRAKLLKAGKPEIRSTHKFMKASQTESQSALGQLIAETRELLEGGGSRNSKMQRQDDFMNKSAPKFNADPSISHGMARKSLRDAARSKQGKDPMQIKQGNANRIAIAKRSGRSIPGNPVGAMAMGMVKKPLPRAPLVKREDRDDLAEGGGSRASKAFRQNQILTKATKGSWYPNKHQDAGEYAYGKSAARDTAAKGPKDPLVRRQRNLGIANDMGKATRGSMRSSIQTRNKALGAPKFETSQGSLPKVSGRRGQRQVKPRMPNRGFTKGSVG